MHRWKGRTRHRQKITGAANKVKQKETRGVADLDDRKLEPAPGGHAEGAGVEGWVPGYPYSLGAARVAISVAHHPGRDQPDVASMPCASRSPSSAHRLQAAAASPPARARIGIVAWALLLGSIDRRAPASVPIIAANKTLCGQAGTRGLTNATTRPAARAAGPPNI